MSLFFTGETVEECHEWVLSLYDEIDFKDKAEFVHAQVIAIMEAKMQTRPYPDFLPNSTTRVRLRDSPEYAFDIDLGVIFNVTTKQILQASRINQVLIGGSMVYAHNEGLKACVPKADYPGVSGDHISRDHNDHRLKNLRWASPALQSSNRQRHSKLNTPTIQVLENGEWVSYETRKIFMQKLTLEPTPARMVRLSEAINKGKKFEGVYVRNGIPDGIGELREVPASVIGAEGYHATEFQGYIRKPNGSFTQGCKDRSGYYVIGINRSVQYVHVLTTYAWHGMKPTEDAQANHKKGAANGPADAKDLEWVTPSENNQHAHDAGLHPGARAVVATLKDGTTQAFRSATEAVRYFKEKNIVLHGSAIACACNGKHKTHGGMTWKYADGGTSRKRKFIDDEE